MSFRLTNALAMFIDYMNWIFHLYLDKLVVVFIEYILVYSKTKEEHAEYLRLLLQILRDKKLWQTIQMWVLDEGCKISRPCSISRGISIDSNKIEAVLNWERPTMVTKVRSFLRLVEYYRRFIKGFFQIVFPLTQLTRKNVPFEWTTKCERRSHELR